MVKIPEEDGMQLIRGEIFKVLTKYEVSDEIAVGILGQCASYVENCGIVGRVAKDLGLALTGFRTDKSMELYYDLEKDGRDLGFISKGWNDPGFRMGEVLTIPQQLVDAFCSRAPEILDFCATNGVVFNARHKDDAMEVTLEVCIYKEGFNTVVFAKTLQAIVDCVSKITEGLPGSSPN